MKNYISINISYLINKINCSQDEFGSIFEIGKNVTGNYILGKSVPKLELIKKICSYFDITIDDFVNSDLSTKKSVVNDSVQVEKLTEIAIAEFQENKKLMQEFNGHLKTKILDLERELFECRKERDGIKKI